MERSDAILQLLDQVPLIAAMASLVHDLMRAQFPIVGDEEEEASLLEELLLALLDDLELSESHDPILALALRRTVRKIDDLLGDGANDLEAALSDDPLLDVLGTSPRRGCDRPLCTPLKLLVEILRSALSAENERFDGVETEDEADLVVGPTIELGRAGEIGVAAKQDISEACSPAQRDRAVEVWDHTLMRRSVAAAVAKEERLASVGQRDHEGAVAPDPVVRDVHSFFALAGRRYDRSIGID